MIKRIVLLAAIATMVSGMVWAQVDEPIRDAGFEGIRNLGASTRGSMEARYSAGRFSTPVDTFINPRFFNPDIGTFVFVGGNLGIGADSMSLTGDTVHVGFARNFGAFYLGVYYGGNLVEAGGWRRREFEPEDLRDTHRSSWAYWENNLAVLLGVAGMGFRLDFVAGHNSGRDTWSGSMDLPDPEFMFVDPDREYVHSWEGRYVNMNGPRRVALTWGTRLLDGAVSPWVRVGYAFSDVELRYNEISNRFGSASIERRLDVGNAFEITGGARFRTGDNSVAGASLHFTNTAGSRERYTFTASGTLPGPAGDRPSIQAPDDFENRYGGMTGFGLNTYFQTSHNLGVVAFGIRPTLDAGMTLVSNSWYGDTIDWHELGDRYFTLRSSVDLGIRLRRSEESRLTFFAGTTVQLFNWNTWAPTGDNDELSEARYSSWSFFGIGAGIPAAFGVLGGNLAFGMTVTPVEYVVIGLGLNSIVNELFADTPYSPRIDLTVSLRLP